MIVNHKLGITLSGGGFRGVAHLGVLQFLSELGIAPDELSGTSAGALIGALIAEGYSPLDILKFCKDEKFFSYSDLLSARRSGLFNTIVFERIVKKYIPHDSFEGLKIPLYVSVTDLTNAQSLMFNQGSLSFAIKCSCSFPLIFQPVKYKDDIFLCDGGIMNNFPVEQMRASCNKVIGINVNPISRMEGNISYKEVISRIIRITTSRMYNIAEKACDIYIQPDEINRYGTFESKRIQEIYDLGYRYAQEFEEEFLRLKESLQSTN